MDGYKMVRLRWMVIKWYELEGIRVGCNCDVEIERRRK